MRPWPIVLLLLLSGCMAPALNDLSGLEGEGLSSDESTTSSDGLEGAEAEDSGSEGGVAIQSDEPAPPTEVPETLPQWDPTVVVADISSGFNPYHEIHRRPGWPHPCFRVVGVPCDMPTVEITFGKAFEDAQARDSALWDALLPGVPVWLNGTNIIFEYQRLDSGRKVAFDPGFHGAATAGVLTQTCPECYTMVYQDTQSIDGEPVRKLAAYPWVDLIVSTNWPGDLDRELEFFLEGPYANATRELYEAGGIFFMGAGNHPVTGLMDITKPVPIHPITWPPWIVLVSGHFDECGGRTLYSGQLTEFTADFDRSVPLPDNVTEYGAAAGTSFSAPGAAGVWAEVLRQVHLLYPSVDAEALWHGAPGPGPLEDGLLTQAELRAVLGAAATIYSAEDYELGCGVKYYGSRPLVEPGPWDSGWGNLDGQAVAVAARFFVNGVPLPEKSGAHQVSMETFQELRATLYPW